MRLRQYIPPHGDELFAKLIKKIGLNRIPVVKNLGIEPILGSEPLNCFENVMKAVERFGGAIVYGWSIWQLPPFFIEAEHHAVWRQKGKKRLRDITHATDVEKSRVFIEDMNAKFDFDNNKSRRGNARIPFYNDIDIETLIVVHEEKERILDSYEFGRVVLSISDSKLWNLLEHEQGRLELLIANKYASRKSF